jgi:hypothetical protein
MEAFGYKCEASTKITRLFEEIFREIEVFIRILRTRSVHRIKKKKVFGCNFSSFFAYD